MDARVLETLEYTKVRAMLAGFTQSGLGRELAERLEPATERAAIEAALAETTEAQAVLTGGAQVPLSGVTDVRELLGRAEKGGSLQPAELVRLASCLRGARELKRYMAAKRRIAPTLSRYAEAIAERRSLEDEIYGSVDGARVASGASPRLAKVRREIAALEGRIQAKLQSFLSSAAYRDLLQESFVSVKAGRYVLPVKASHRHKLDGLVIDSSGTGSTVFIEPAAVRKLANDLQALRSVEEAEEYQVLAALSGLVAAEAPAIRANLEVMAAYDFAFAKGRLSLAMGARSVAVNDCGVIQIRQGRHPLLKDQAVPLDLALGRRYRTLVITGPNTGGKTVALKTVGLLALMAQAGLHVPVGEGSELTIFQQILTDIGDGQSIEQSLSTFSSHMSQIAAILQQVAPCSLVLIDEVGTGTDPAEGAALAAAILEELHGAGGMTLATTHYSDVKRLADLHHGFINGRMDFDPDTLKPRFRLIMGEAGSSHAFWIADRLGIGRRVLDRAAEHLRAARGGHVQAAVGVGTAEGSPGLPEGSPKLPEEWQAQSDAAELPAAAPGTAAALPAAAAPAAPRPWQLGDMVLIQTLEQQGIVAELPNARGEMVIFTRGKRVTVNHKRLTLLVAAENLYPEGYDLTTALYTWQDREFMHDAERKHTGGYRVITKGRRE
ncbi:MAG: endonuclease MutS2 [Symbiobacteriia bacterium]